VSVPVIAFFSVKGGVGTTSLVYHLAWMFADLGVKVLAVDMDPQASLTTSFIGTAMPGSAHDSNDDDSDSQAHIVDENLCLLPSVLEIAAFEEEFAIQWQRAMDGGEESFSVVSRPWQLTRALAAMHQVQLVLADIGPNLTAINRAGLIAADHIVVPLVPDVLAVSALVTLGSALQKWRKDWRDRLARAPSNMELPAGGMAPLGYVIQERGSVIRAEKNGFKWTAENYRKFVLGVPPSSGVSVVDDPNKLAVLRPYPSLMAMAQEARKPMFHLKPADGAIGAYLQSAEDSRRDFEALAKAIVAKAKLPIAFSR
jgi:cellulose biosynthesis protein BcsQ